MRCTTRVSLRCERPEYLLTRHRSALHHTVQPVMCIRRSCLFRRAVALQIPLSESSLVLGTGKVRHLGLWSESMAPCSPVLRFRISEVRCLCVPEHSGALSSDFLRVAFATGVCEINTHPTCGPSWAAPAPCHAQCQGHTQAE